MKTVALASLGIKSTVTPAGNPVKDPVILTCVWRKNFANDDIFSLNRTGIFIFNGIFECVPRLGEEFIGRGNVHHRFGHPHVRAEDHDLTVITVIGRKLFRGKHVRHNLRPVGNRGRIGHAVCNRYKDVKTTLGAGRNADVLVKTLSLRCR